MTFGIYSIRDSLTGFMQPSFEQNDACAMRNFRSAILSVHAGSLLNSDPQDFTLCKIGNFDTDSGNITSLLDPLPILTGSSVMLDSFKEASHGNV